MQNPFAVALRTIELPTDPRQLAEWYRSWKAVEKIGKEIEKTVKRQIAEAGECGGLRMEERPGAREIRNAVDAFGMLRDVMDAHEFLSACKVSVPKLEKAYIDSTGAKTESGRLKKGERERAEKAFADTLGELIGTGAPRRSIVESQA